MAHGTRMNERWTADRSGPPDVVGDESSRYFRKGVKYVIFWRSHWPAGRQCRHIVDAESSKHLTAAATSTAVRDGHRAAAVVKRLRDTRRPITRARKVGMLDVYDDNPETDFGYFDRDEI